MRLTPKDKKVIQEFYEQTSAESKKLYTDGKVLDGLWMGGNAIAEWEGRKIKFNDLGSNASVTVQRAVKKYVPANYLKLSSTRRSASEVIKSLEMRVARLERQTGQTRRRVASQVANTIVQQLGGSRKLQMFIGLKQILTASNAVTLVFPKPKHRGAVNRVRITLNGMDLYDMEFIRTHGRSVKVVKEFNDVYAEDIKDRFEEGTGLYIRF